MPEMEDIVERDGILVKEITPLVIYRKLMQVSTTVEELQEDFRSTNHFQERLKKIEDNCAFQTISPDGPFQKLLSDVGEIKNAQCEAENLSKGRLNLRGDIITLTLFAFAVLGGLFSIINFARSLALQ